MLVCRLKSLHLSKLTTSEIKARKQGSPKFVRGLNLARVNGRKGCPPAGANLGGFEVKDYDFGAEETLEDGKRRQSLQFQLRTFTTGDYVIPPLPIEYTLPDATIKYISADPLKIFIKIINLSVINFS